MAKRYSSRDFFRQMPNVLLAPYFQGHELFADLDFTAMKEGKPEALFTAWLELPDDRCHGMSGSGRGVDLGCRHQ
jgi:hypothetical protein